MDYDNSDQFAQSSGPKDSQRFRAMRRVLGAVENGCPPPVELSAGDCGGFGKSHSHLQFGASQRILTNRNESSMFGQSMISMVPNTRPPPTSIYSEDSMASSARPSSSMTLVSGASFSGEFYDVMTSTEDFLSDLYPLGHEYNRLGRRRVFREIIKSMVEQQLLTAAMDSCKWRTSVCWSLLCQFGMCPRPITNQVLIAALGSNTTSAVHSSLRPPQSSSKGAPQSYKSVVFLSAVGGDEYRTRRPQLKDTDCAVLGTDWLCLKVHTEPSATSGLMAVPLSVQKCAEAVQFLAARYVISKGSTGSECGQSLILCESADVLLPALSVAAAYVHWVEALPLLVSKTDDESNTSAGAGHHDDEGEADMNDTVTDTTQTQPLDPVPDNGEEPMYEEEQSRPVQLNLRAFEHVLCVVPEVLSRLALVLSDPLVCAVHLPHLQQFAATLRHLRGECRLVVEREQYNDRVGIHWLCAQNWLQQATDTALLWHEEYMELAEDLQQMAVQWAERSSPMALFNRRVALLSAQRAQMSDVLLFEPTHVLCLSASVDYLKGFVSVPVSPSKTKASPDVCRCTPQSSVNRLSVLSCASVMECVDVRLMDESNPMTAQPTEPEFARCTTFLADAFGWPDARVLVLCGLGVHEWMGAVLFSQYVHSSTGTAHGQLLCAMTAANLVPLTLPNELSALRLDHKHKLLKHWAIAIHRADSDNKVSPYVHSVQSKKHGLALQHWVAALTEQHTLCSFTDHKCEATPFGGLDDALRTMICRVSCSCGIHNTEEKKREKRVLEPKVKMPAVKKSCLKK